MYVEERSVFFSPEFRTILKAVSHTFAHRVCVIIVLKKKELSVRLCYFSVLPFSKTLEKKGKNLHKSFTASVHGVLWPFHLRWHVQRVIYTFAHTFILMKCTPLFSHPCPTSSPTPHPLRNPHEITLSFIFLGGRTIWSLRVM